MGLKAYSGVGCVYMASVDADGNKTTDWRKVGNAYPLTAQVETDKQEQKSRMCDTAGQILATKTEITDTKGSLVLKEWNARNLAMALSGEAVAMTGSGGTVSDEAVTAPAPDEYVSLDHVDVSSVVVTDSPETTTYTEGTDYLLNKKLGLLTIISGGAIAENDALLIDYTYAAESGYQVNVGTTAQFRVAILANLKDEFDSTREFTIEIDSAVIASSAEINFISDPGSEGEDLSFGFTMETLANQTSPMRIKGIAA